MVYGLRFLALQISNSTLALSADNSTAISYLRYQGGSRSPLLNSIAQRILRWAESLPIVFASQFIMGLNIVLADFFSRPIQILGSEWTLKTEVFQHLSKRWPFSIDLFATSLNHQCCPYFSPFPRSECSGHGCSAPELEWVAGVCLSYLASHSYSVEEAPVVLWSPLTIIAPYWPQRPWFPELLDLVVDGPIPLPLSCELLRQAALSLSSSGSVRVVSSCVETIQRFARSQGFSLHVARQASLARRFFFSHWLSGKWAVYRQWCRAEEYSISRPSLPKVLTFFFFGFVGRGNCLYLLLWDTARCFRRFLFSAS